MVKMGPNKSFGPQTAGMLLNQASSVSPTPIPHVQEVLKFILIGWIWRRLDGFEKLCFRWECCLHWDVDVVRGRFSAVLFKIKKGIPILLERNS